MAFALWLVGAYVVIVCFGTWALQIALWLLAAALRIGGWTLMILFGLLSLLALAILDREQLARVWRGEPPGADTAALSAAKRWA